MSTEVTTQNGLDLKKQEMEMERNKWRGRRKMSWTSLISMVFVTIVILLGPTSVEKLKILSEMITWFYFAMASIIGAYMGFTTWASIKK